MSEARARRMSLEEFLPWQETQETRYEYVDGRPVAMTGAKNRHDQIVVNALVAIGSRIDRTRCRPFTADIAVITRNGNARHPDLGIDCGRRDPDSYVATAPVAVFEVLSPSNRPIDVLRKLDDYRDLESMQHVVVVDPEHPDVALWSRTAQGWRSEDLFEMSASISLAAIPVELTLAELYADVPLKPRLAPVSGPPHK